MGLLGLVLAVLWEPAGGELRTPALGRLGVDRYGDRGLDDVVRRVAAGARRPRPRSFRGSRRGIGTGRREYPGPPARRALPGRWSAGLRLLRWRDSAGLELRLDERNGATFFRRALAGCPTRLSEKSRPL